MAYDVKGNLRSVLAQLPSDVRLVAVSKYHPTAYIEAAYAEGQRSVAAQMLTVLDNIERALASAEDDSPLKSGIELTLKQMQDAYEKLGVTPIDRVGEKFDPNLENAILQGTPEEGEPGTVCQVLQKGYRMGKKVLRHAMVKVVPE